MPDSLRSEMDQISDLVSPQQEPETPPASDTTPTEPPRDAAPEQSIPTTLVEFATAAGWDPADVYGLTVKLTDHGEEIPLGKLKDRLQDYERESGQMAERRAALEQAQQYLAQQAQHLAQQSAELPAAIHDAQAQVRAIELLYTQVPWEELLRQDPANHANLQLEIRQRHAEAMQALQTVSAQHQHTQREAYRAAAQEQYQRFLQVVPEWRNPEVARQEGRGMDEMLAALGFSEDERHNRIDARQRVLDRMALLYIQQQSTMSKVKAAPKPVLRPGNGQGIPQARLKELTERAKKSGSKTDQLAAISALIKG